MNRELVLALALTLLVGTLSVASNVQRTKASGTIYIRADGSIDPPDAPISTVDNVTYTLTGNIHDLIVIERDNIVVDGVGYTLQEAGVDLSGRTNVTVQNAQITFSQGIRLSHSSNNSIVRCNITNNGFGIFLVWSNGNVIVDNIIGASSIGIYLGESTGNSLTHNSFLGCEMGVWLEGCVLGDYITRNDFFCNEYGIFDYHGLSDNLMIYHNNFMNCRADVCDGGDNNTWNYGYPSGGNYWSDYISADIYCGQYQNETGSDNIGDLPFVINANNQDNYPLIRPYVSFENQTIYIRADGSVDPSGAPIRRMGDIYTLTGDISSVASGIVVERDNVTLEGEGFSFEGGGNGVGVSLSGRSNVTIENVTVKSFEYGIYLWNSSYCNVIGNNLTENCWGMMLFLHSSHNVIMGNNITHNMGDGIRNGEYGDSSEDSTISGNYIAENNIGIYVGVSSNSTIANNRIDANIDCGIRVDWSSNISILQNNLTDNGFPFGHQAICIWNSSNCDVLRNRIGRSDSCGLFIEDAVAINVIQNEVVGNAGGLRFVDSINSLVVGNSFVNNTLQAYVINSSVAWNGSYSSGGNYWSDYSGRDVFRGVLQNETGSDGIGDSAYEIDSANRDNYPLMKPYPWGDHDLGITYIGRIYSFDLVVPLKTIVGLRFSLNISTFVMNYGNQTESFNVQVIANDTLVGTFSNVTLESRQSVVLNLRWNTTGFAYGNYTVRAVADNVSGETGISDNAYTDGIVYVGIPGDINGDGEVDIKDIAYVAMRFGKNPGDPGWSPIADLNDDEIIDIFDVSSAARHFGEHYP